MDPYLAIDVVPPVSAEDGKTSSNNSERTSCVWVGTTNIMCVSWLFRMHIHNVLVMGEQNMFWAYLIARVRPVIQLIIRLCAICQKLRWRPGMQCIADDFPPDRVTQNGPSFANGGIDCLGPFLVKRGRAQLKRYGWLFTCLKMRAEHIEKLDCLETDSFINGLTRFAARRVIPQRKGLIMHHTLQVIIKSYMSLLRNGMTARKLEIGSSWRIVNGKFESVHSFGHGWYVGKANQYHNGKVLTAIVGSWQLLDDERLEIFFSVRRSQSLMADH